MKKIEVEITQEEFEELVAKLANEIEVYGEQSSPALISIFHKIIAVNPFPDVRFTTLVKNMI